MTKEITITLPDGSKKKVPSGTTPRDVALTISEGLTRACVAAKVNDEIIDMTRPLEEDCTLRLLTFKDEEGVDVFRHSAAHLLANAVLELFPYAKMTIGPLIEEGFYYDFDHEPFTDEQIAQIEDKMKEICKRKLDVERLVLTKEEALETFKDNKYKVELINEIEDNEDITAYRQGSFVDLCRGPHVPNTGMLKAVKIVKSSGAYWRGDAKNTMLQRLYGVAFPDKKDLKLFLTRMEDAKKRDHRKIGRDLDLFFSHELSPGSTFFYPKGTIIYNELQKLMREEYFVRGYDEVITPIIYNKRLWEMSGHWEHFKDNMFHTEVEGEHFCLKPMNCPGHLLIFKSKLHSYRDLPIRIADFGNLHRNELSGTLSGITRVRRMCQDDAHIFITPEQIQSEITNMIDFIKKIYTQVFDFEFTTELSTKPAKAIGDPKAWEASEAALQEALHANNIEFKINPGDGAFYGPKIDFHIKDAIGRSWQCATIQLDFNLPERFDACYEGQDGKRHRVIMIHRAIFGSIERFLGMLIEHYAGKFPLWLNPIQVKILTLADRHTDYADEICRKYREKGIRAQVDARAETINKKVREAQLQQVNYILVVGDREMEKKSVNVRLRNNEVLGEKDVDDLLAVLQKEIAERSNTTDHHLTNKE